MPIDNLGRKHITPAQITAIDAALDTVINTLTAITTNLNDEDRKKFGSINEQNKLFANSIQDYASTQPELKSTDIDWVEFNADYTDRKWADTRIHRLERALMMIRDFKIVHDYDNYQDALTDKRYTDYKASTNTPGFAEKAAHLKQFFPNTGGTAPTTTNTETNA